MSKELLDLDDWDNFKEDAFKLFEFSLNNQILALRSENGKGIKLISLLDGGILQ
jgi:hypothetical protein